MNGRFGETERKIQTLLEWQLWADKRQSSKATLTSVEHCGTFDLGISILNSDHLVPMYEE